VVRLNTFNAKDGILDKLIIEDIELSLQHILDNSKAESGGERDVTFLKSLVEEGLLSCKKAFLKRNFLDKSEEYYKETYKKIKYESNRHFLCRAIVQEELKNLGISTISGTNVGDMSILSSNSFYDIVSDDFSTLIDIGFTPACNFFRGLTDMRVNAYLITTYFDDYMDDILFTLLKREDDKLFIDEIRDYVKKSNIYHPDAFYTSERHIPNIDPNNAP